MRPIDRPFPEYSFAEEVAHAVTHGIGAVLSAVGLVILVLAALDTGTPLALTAAGVYGVTLFLCYITSALYHGVPHPRAKQFFLLLDHCAIYLLIAGTYTPFVLLMPLKVGWLLGIAIWTLAAIGIAFKIYAYRTGSFGRFERISVILYLGMGWSGLVWAWEVVQYLPPWGMIWLIAGGVTYTVGVLAYLADHIRYHHAVWHLFVLIASACHFWIILSYVLPVAAQLSLTAL